MYNFPCQKQKMTPPELSRLWGVSIGKIMSYILSGELPAINSAASDTSGKRPRYLIDVSDLKEFERRRTVRPSNGSAK